MIEKQAAMALLKDRFRPIFNITAHKHAEFLAKAKGDEIIAMNYTFTWVKDMIDSYLEAENYLKSICNKEKQ